MVSSGAFTLGGKLICASRSISGCTVSFGGVSCGGVSAGGVGSSTVRGGVVSAWGVSSRNVGGGMIGAWVHSGEGSSTWVITGRTVPTPSPCFRIWTK